MSGRAGGSTVGGAMAVVIGRNEGERLRRALGAAMDQGLSPVYVDSGSTDGSAALARGLGAVVVELDPSRPFTAARGRNEGLERALALSPGLELVQFIDGDCELLPGWIGVAVEALAADPALAAVCGRVRERHRDLSIYNRLCDLEWDAPAGETASCGGNALMRVACLREAGGFRPELLGGEEPELCLRLRRRGWRIQRLARDMVLHDADMTRFGQWWRRAVRSGWAYAEGAWLHRGSAERPWRRECRSILFWGAILPLAALLLALPTGGLGLLLLSGYPLLAARIRAAELRAGRPPADARLRAAFLVLAKFPQAQGLLHFAAGGRRRPAGEGAAAGGEARTGPDRT